jgi:signal transduction histidine kinase/CheY-like chemotaxis protein
VRYISHEIRTPLNSAFLGLRMLLDDLKNSKEPKDAERLETLSDVNVSCVTAIDILNDLLCFEKIESGILQLHRTDEPILPFMEACVNMFSAQARECGVRLELVLVHDHDRDESKHDIITATAAAAAGAATLSPRDSDQLSPRSRSVISQLPLALDLSSIRNPAAKCTILPSDTICIDKFKMDQVVRNLISNALKFSPRGGKVTVKAWIEKSEGAEGYSSVSQKGEGQYGGSQKSTARGERKGESRLRKLVSGEFRFQGSGKWNMESSKDSQDKLIITVTDEGAGISPENQQRLFKEVVQFNPEKLQAGGGSGFGLFITKGIVDLHGGTINVYSAGEDHGCTFTVSIPIKNDARKSSEAPMQSARTLGSVKVAVDAHAPIPSDRIIRHPGADEAANANGEGKVPVATITSTNISNGDTGSGRGSAIRTRTETSGYRLLVVDDSHLNRKMLCKLLRGAGHTCDEADDGDVAVDKVKELIRQAGGGEDTGGHREYDCILMDYVMPRLEGPKAAREIRNMGYRGRIAGLTGNGLQADIDYYVSSGANQVFVKPLDVDEFHRYLSRDREGTEV